jgi:hypothetical protein
MVKVTVELTKILTKGDLYLAYDNDITVYLNGQNVYSKQKEGCGAYWNDEIAVSGFNTGKNVLVCVVKDRGDASFFDAKLIAYGISQGDVIPITSPIPLVPSNLKVLMSNGSVVTNDLDEYLKGVVAAEMYSSWPIEALKAQAVASRTFAIANTHHDHINVDVCTNPGCCQAWKAGPYSENVEKAVTETHNEVLTYSGQIAKEALFFAHCNGHTRNSEDYCPGGHCWDYVPYLRSAPCDCGFSDYYGSGVGMCQQGAKSMAEQGYSYVDILKHYYTGIEVASSSPASAEQPLFKLFR